MTADRDLRQIARRFMPFLRLRWMGLALALVGMLGQLVTDLASPWPLKLVFDVLLGGRRAPFGIALTTPADRAAFLAAITAAIVGLAMLDGLFSYWREYSLSRTGQELAFDLRTTLYAHIQRLSFGFYESQRTGDLIKRVTSDTDSIQDFLTDSLFTIISSVLTITSMLLVMLWMDYTLALAAFALAPVLFAVVYRYTTRIRELSRFQRRQDGVLASVAQEAISAVRVVKAFSREEHENERFRLHGERSLETGLQVSRLEAQFGWVADVVTAFGTAGVMVLGVRRAMAGVVTPGDLLVFTSYLKRLFKPMRAFAKEINRISKALARAERVVEVLDADPGVQDTPDARPAHRFRGAIRFEDVSFGYRSGEPVLQDVSFAVEPGQTVALVGETGAGKTTLAALIPRFYDPTVGCVRIDGTDVRRFTLKTLRDQVSLVLQESVLFRATVAENIAYGSPSAGMAEIVAAARAAHADGFIRALPDGYETIIGERGATLSGGQRQRLAIARAIVRDAPIVLLDEPTTGLDAATEALVLEALARLTTGRTTIVIAHDLSTVARADLVLVLDRGRIVERGTPSELLARRGRYYELYSLRANVR